MLKICSHESGTLKGSQKGSEEVSMGIGSHYRTSSLFATLGTLVAAIEGEDSIPQVPGGLTVMVIIYSANDTRVGVCSDKNSSSLSPGGTVIKTEWGQHLTCSLCQPSSLALEFTQ